MISGISEKDLMITTGLPKIYEELVDEKKLFNRRHHLFSFGLVYGLLLNLHSTIKPYSDIVRLNVIREQLTKDIVDIVYMVINDGNKTEEQVFNQMLHIADAGVTELKKIYDKNSDFSIPNLILDAEKLWETRVQDLKNITTQEK
jgi:hypothetical protein